MPAAALLNGAAGVYATTDPLSLALWVCMALAVLCWALSVATDNYSQVDRLWSLAPSLYACHFAARADFAEARLNIVALLVTLWGARLTYNFWRKGGYRWRAEDYRWAPLRERLGPVGFQLLNATFIAPYQNLLLLLLTAPAYVAWQHRGTPLGTLDAAATATFLLLLAGEAVADQQQWRFQSDKQARQARGEAIVDRFLTRGLFR